MTSINDIISHINKNFFAKPNRYTVEIQGSYGKTLVPDASRDVSFNCSQVNIPGLNIAITQHRKYGIGVPTFVPTGKSFTECTLTFYESEKMNERKYFSLWMSSMQDPVTGRMNYFDSIKKNLKITQYDLKDNITYQCILHECFPSNISPIDRAYSAENTVSQFVVSLQFRKMEEIFKN